MGAGDADRGLPANIHNGELEEGMRSAHVDQRPPWAAEKILQAREHRDLILQGNRISRRGQTPRIERPSDQGLIPNVKQAALHEDRIGVGFGDELGFPFQRTDANRSLIRRSGDGSRLKQEMPSIRQKPWKPVRDLLPSSTQPADRNGRSSSIRNPTEDTVLVHKNRITPFAFQVPPAYFCGRSEEQRALHLGV